MAATESFPEGLAGLEALRASVPPVAGTFPFGAPVQPFFGAQFPVNSSPIQQGRNSGGSRTGVCASRHMAAEQRRRARINGRLEALRTLVPHSARANTASFLTEVYNYITSLHKQLESLGHNPLDLNASMAESAGGKKGADNPCTSSMKEGANPKFQELRSDESDVEFDEMKHNTDDENGKSDGNGSDASPVLAPSLFDPSNRKLAENKPATSTDTIHSNTSDVFNSVHSSAFTSVNSDLSLSMKPPASPATSNTCHGPEMATSSSAPHIISALVPPSMSASKSRRLREIQPAPMQKSMIQTPAYPFMSISSSAVAAAAAAIAESAAVAQSWGMAAVVAQAQAQVAAQVHAQAQAQVQAMSQAQSQLHTLNSVAHPCSGLSVTCPPVYQPVSQPKKRRRGGMSDSSPNRSRIAQTVVRPIALKPQP